MSVARYFDEMNYGPAPEADTEVRAWLKRHDAAFGHFIDGEFVPPSSGDLRRQDGAGDRRKLARIANGNAADVDAAVAAARKAQGKWAKLGGPARARHLYALARMVQRHGRLFAVLEALDNGKPIRERATSTSRWRPGTSIITPAGRSCRSANSPTRCRSASSARSFRGTSRC